MPYNLIFLGLLVIFLRTKKRWEKVLLGGIIVCFYLFSNSYLVSWCSMKWELPRKNIHSLDSYEYGIVLSGGLLNTCPNFQNTFDLDSGSDRLLTAFLLYKKGKCRKLIITGTNSDYLLEKGVGEVQLARNLLIEWGMPEDDIILELKARNTRENAVFVSQIMNNTPVSGPSILITSGFHMRRAVACFKKVGLTVVPFAADLADSGICYPTKKKVLPDPEAFASFQRLSREWVGLIMYRLSGYC